MAVKVKILDCDNRGIVARNPLAIKVRKNANGVVKITVYCKINVDNQLNTPLKDGTDYVLTNIENIVIIGNPQ